VLFGLYVCVRLAGIGPEAVATGVSPELIAAPLYLVVAAGLPAVAYRVRRGADPVWAFTHMVGGVGTAFLVDFVLMGVAVVPLRFALHRLAVVVAVGPVGDGTAAASDDGSLAPLLVGLVGWLLALGLPLFGYA
jgi:hypothetical protein